MPDQHRFSSDQKRLMDAIGEALEESRRRAEKDIDSLLEIRYAIQNYNPPQDHYLYPNLPDTKEIILEWLDHQITSASNISFPSGSTYE